MTRSPRAIPAACLVLSGLATILWFAGEPAADHALVAAPKDATKAPPAPVKDVFADTVRPVFAQFCLGCHNDKKVSAGLTLDPYKTAADARNARDLWDTVKDQLANKQMPPKGKPQPTDEQRKAVIAWID